MTDKPVPNDLARDLEADLEIATVTDSQLWEWGEAEDRDYIHAARFAWPAAIRRALHAEAEVARLREQIRGHAARIAQQSELLSRAAERQE